MDENFTTDRDLDALERRVRTAEPGPAVPLSTNTALALIDLARLSVKNAQPIRSWEEMIDPPPTPST